MTTKQFLPVDIDKTRRKKGVRVRVPRSLLDITLVQPEPERAPDINLGGTEFGGRPLTPYGMPTITPGQFAAARPELDIGLIDRTLLDKTVFTATPSEARRIQSRIALLPGELQIQAQERFERAAPSPRLGLLGTVGVVSERLQRSEQASFGAVLRGVQLFTEQVNKLPFSRENAFDRKLQEFGENFDAAEGDFWEKARKAEIATDFPWGVKGAGEALFNLENLIPLPLLDDLARLGINLAGRGASRSLALALASAARAGKPLAPLVESILAKTARPAFAGRRARDEGFFTLEAFDQELKRLNNAIKRREKAGKNAADLIEEEESTRILRDDLFKDALGDDFDEFVRLEEALSEAEVELRGLREFKGPAAPRFGTPERSEFDNIRRLKSEAGVNVRPRAVQMEEVRDRIKSIDFALGNLEDKANKLLAEPTPVDEISVMGVKSKVSQSEVIDGVRYELFTAIDPDDTRTVFRIFDEDAGEVAVLKQFPSTEDAQKLFGDSVRRARLGSDVSPQIGQGQAGFDIGEHPSQGQLLGEFQGRTPEQTPLIDRTRIEAQQARQAEVTRGQQELPEGDVGALLPEFKPLTPIDKQSTGISTSGEALTLQRDALPVPSAGSTVPPSGSGPLGPIGDVPQPGARPGDVPPSPAGITDALTKADALVDLDTPGTLSNLLQRIPILRQIREFERPALKMMRKGQRFILQAWVAQRSVQASLKTDFYKSYVPTLKSVERAFEPGFVEGRAKVDLKASVTAKQPEWAGQWTDVVQRYKQGIFVLTDEQRLVLDKIDPRNNDLLDFVNADYGTKIGKFSNESGAFWPNIDVSEGATDILEELGRNPASALRSGRGKTRVFETAYDRWLKDPTFVPESDMRKVLAAMDDFKASRAASETFKQSVGGKTLVEALEETHPNLLKARQALNRQVRNLRNRLNTSANLSRTTFTKGKQNLRKLQNLENKAEQIVDDMEGLAPEFGDTFQRLAAELDDIAKQGSKLAREGRALEETFISSELKSTTLADELEDALKNLVSIRRSVKAANLRGFTLVKEGNLFRYFKPAEASTIDDLLKVSNNAALNFIENIRKGVLVLDASPITGVQAPMLFLASPINTSIAWIKGLATGIKRGDPFGAFRQENIARDIAADPKTWSDFSFMMGFPVGAVPEEFAIGFLSKVPILGKIVTGINEGMFVSVMRGGKNLYKHEFDNLIKAGANPTQASALAADAVTRFNPLLNPARLGQSQARAKLIRSAVISVSFIRRPAELLSDATTGYLKIMSGQTLTAKQALSVKYATTLMASTFSLSIASAAISAKAQGRDELEAIKEVLDINSGKFMSIVIGRRRILIGGPFRGMLKAVIPQTRTGNIPFGGIPQFAINRMTPLARTAKDLLQNEDFFGNKIAISEGPRRILEYALYAAEGVLPITLQEVMRGIRLDLEIGDTAEQVSSQMAGWNMYDETPFQRRTTEAKKWAKNRGLEIENFWDLSPSKRQEFEKEEPELFAAIIKERNRRAKFGNETAIRQLAADNVKEQAVVNQTADDRLLESGGLGPRQWRSNRTDRSQDLNSRRDQLYKDLDPIEPKTPTDFYYAKIDELEEKFNGIMTNTAWDELDQWIASLSQEDQTFIETNTRLGALTPKVQEYYDALDILNPYFEIDESYLDIIADPALKRVWRRWLRAGQARRQLIETETDLRVVKRGVRILKEQMRQQVAGVDAMLIKWGYSPSPQTSAGFDELDKILGAQATQVASTTTPERRKRGVRVTVPAGLR